MQKNCYICDRIAVMHCQACNSYICYRHYEFHGNKCVVYTNTKFERQKV